MMNNAVFGKTCEDVRRYTDIKIVTEEEQIKKLAVKEQFKRWKIYNENLAAVAMEKKQVKLDKPRYIGSAILAISKTLMYEFHYKYMMPTFPGSKVIFTDTDSLCYIIPDVQNVHEVIKGSKRFDFSNFPQDHPNYSTDYRMVPGKFKDECPYSMIVEVD